MRGEHWRIRDCMVAALALPSLLLLGLLLFGEQEVPSTPSERAQVLAVASLLLLISVFVCCYVTRRLGLSCCLLAGHTYQPAGVTLPLISSRDPEQPPPPTYDTFINFAPVAEPRAMTKAPSSTVEPCSVHLQLASLQRASRDQVCYQNLRPQEDNG